MRATTLLCSALAMSCSGPTPHVVANAKIAHTGPSSEAPSTGSLEIYFVRHGETVANATGRYNSRTIDTFSDLGAREVANLVKRLHGIKFDAAICSPSPRAEKTAAAVLRDHRLKAQVWPALNECCTQPRRTWSQPGRKAVAYDGPVVIGRSLSDVLTTHPGDTRRIADGNYQDGLLQTKLAVAQFQKEFGGKGLRILVVGHSGQGSRFIEQLLGRQPAGRIRLDNTEVVVLTEVRGSFAIKGVSRFSPK